MKKKLFYLLLAVLPFVITSCATMFNGRTSWLNVETSPENVAVKIYEVDTGITYNQTAPFMMELSKKSDYKLVIESPNYKSDEVIIRRRLSGWVFGNLLLGGIIGFGIDALTGNMWKHNQNIVKMNLSSKEEAPDKVTLDIPFTFQNADGSKFVKYIPLTFRKKMEAKII